MTRNPGTPEPVSHYPSPTSKSLDSWLDPEAGRVLEPSVPTWLRQIAWKRAVDIAAASTAVSGGIIAILLGAYWSIFTRDVVPLTVFGVLGVALFLTGILVIRRLRSRLPNERALRVVRGPSSGRGGVITAAALWGVLAVIVIPSWLSAAPASDPDGVMLIGLLLFLALLLAAVFAVPGIIIGRAAESLRRAAAEPDYRALLEQERLQWHPQFGDLSFGPL